MANISKYADKVVPGEIVWRDRGGNAHRISGMTTSHLFFTIRMVWNHSAPKPLKLYPYQPYVFSSYYTKEYIIKAIRAMLNELDKRTGLSDHNRKELNHIKVCSVGLSKLLR